MLSDLFKRIMPLIHALLDPILVPLARLWQKEPIRILVVISVGLQALYTLSTGGEPLQAIIQGVALAILGEVQRQSVYSPGTVQELVDVAAATGVPDAGSPPDAEPPLVGPA